jgi:copper chaperone
MSQIVLAVQGMTCQHCVAAVEKALRQVPGVQEVVVDLDAGRASVQGESLVPVALVQVIEEEGYTAQPVQ